MNIRVGSTGQYTGQSTSRLAQNKTDCFQFSSKRNIVKVYVSHTQGTDWQWHGACHYWNGMFHYCEPKAGRTDAESLPPEWGARSWDCHWRWQPLPRLTVHTRYVNTWHILLVLPASPSPWWHSVTKGWLHVLQNCKESLKASILSWCTGGHLLWHWHCQ